MGHLPYPNTFDWDFKENESHLERKQVSREEKLIREFIFLIFGERELLDFYVKAKKFLELFDTREKSRDWLFVFSLSTRWPISADYNGLYGNQVSDFRNCGGEKVRQGWLMFKRKKTVPLMR